jgi:carboxypeptidase D
LENIPIVHVIETYTQLVDYKTAVYDYLREQSHICKFDLNLTYPQTEKLPYTRITKGLLGHRLPQPTRHDLGDPEGFMRELHERWFALPEDERCRSPEERELRRREWLRENVGGEEDAVSPASKRALPPIPGVPEINVTLTGKMNPFFGCDLRDTAMLYALNFTYPWGSCLLSDLWRAMV